MPLTVTMLESQRDVDLKDKGWFTSYKVTVNDGSTETAGAELFQRKDSVPPKVGDVIDGTLEPGKYGPKIRKNAKPGGFGGGPRQRDPKETAAIQRQHSQSVAVEYLIFRAQLDDELPKEWLTRDGLRDLIDWFQEDIEYGVRLSQQPSYGKPRKIKDTVQTGKSDIPAPADGDFKHPPEEWAA